MSAYGYRAVHPAFQAAQYIEHYVDIAAAVIHDCLLGAEHILTRALALHEDLSAYQEEPGCQSLRDLIRFRDGLFDSAVVRDAADVRNEFRSHLHAVGPPDRATRPWYWRGTVVDPDTFSTIVRKLQRDPCPSERNVAQHLRNIRHYFDVAATAVPTLQETRSQGLGHGREERIFFDIVQGLESLSNDHTGHGTALPTLISLEDDNLQTIYDHDCPKALILARDIICGILPGPSILTVRTAVDLFLQPACHDLAQTFRNHDAHDLEGSCLDLARHVNIHPQRVRRILRELRLSMEEIIAEREQPVSAPSTYDDEPESPIAPEPDALYPRHPHERDVQHQATQAPVIPSMSAPATPSMPVVIPPPPQAPWDEIPAMSAPAPPSNPFVIPPPPQVPTQAPWDVVTWINPYLSTNSQFLWDVIFAPGTGRVAASLPQWWPNALDMEMFAFLPHSVRTVHFTTTNSIVNFMMAEDKWGPLKLEETAPITVKTALTKIYEYFAKPITEGEMSDLSSWGWRSQLEAARWLRNREALSYQPAGGGDFLRSDVLGQARRFGEMSLCWEEGLWKVVIAFETGKVPHWWHAERYR
ncbi:hypothetical protein BDZ89DRAFT_1056605 [Hymenopellis radicata]|nr:hypothetical protein BDZ89DRAFT_1056605 [Hymenopellis radicata]